MSSMYSHNSLPFDFFIDSVFSRNAQQLRDKFVVVIDLTTRPASAASVPLKGASVLRPSAWEAALLLCTLSVRLCVRLVNDYACDIGRIPTSV